MLTRRSFLKSTVSGASLVALAPTVPAFLARSLAAETQAHDGRILVVIELNGGNDGINTVVPFADEGYARHRTALRLPADRLHMLSDGIGLHPSMRAAADLVEDGRLAIVQGVGYPNPDRSHFRSMAIWQSARFDEREHGTFGWLGRTLDAAPSTAAGPAAMGVGVGDPPLAIRGRRAVHATIERFEDIELEGLARTDVSADAAGITANGADDLASFVRRRTLDAYATADRLADVSRPEDSAARYPATKLGGRLQLVARLIKADLGPRVFYTVQPGYDTHAAQLNEHARLLAEFSGAVKAFLDDLKAARLHDRVAVLAFSEFGRRVAENGSQGTDH
ncbi:MAG TPA: DUF1501 domain-containing protein, partial [Planctomycetaceae bacterium]|nr:DUF1501 domain-containing protein [Planctomycetaceae bacterium]